MATIVGTQASDNIRGAIGGDTIIANQGNDTITGVTQPKANLLVDGSFETARVGPHSWSHFASVGGWRSDTGVEVWGKDFIKKASNGDKLMELDYDHRFSKVWQDVTTSAGEEYNLSLDTAMRPGTNPGTNSVNVFWNGKLVAHISPGSTDWQTNSFKVIGTGGLDRLEFREDAAGNDSLGGLVDNVILSHKATGNVLVGGSGNDSITAGNDGDILIGGSYHGSGAVTAASALADAHISHAGHEHRANSPLDNDTLNGGAGNDTLIGGSGHDTLNGGQGRNVIDAGSGNDRIVAGGGIDTIIGGKGFDTIDFSNANHGVVVNLAAHSGVGFGQQSIRGVEAIVGSALNDVLTGDAGNNAINGGAGADIITGGRGDDILTGGLGADRFLIGRADLGHGVDKITDFGRGHDVLDLRGIAGGPGSPNHAKVMTHDTAAGTEVFVKMHGQFVEVALLENVHHMSAAHMMQSGMLLV